jgi:hypothetical protein
MNYNMGVTYKTEVAAKDMPETKDPEEVAKPFSRHSCNMGQWWEDKPKSEWVVGRLTHVVKDVKVNKQGGLDITFEFMNNVKGYELAKQFDKDKFKFVPVLSKNDQGIDTSRIDVVKK